LETELGVGKSKENKISADRSNSCFKFRGWNLGVIKVPVPILKNFGIGFGSRAYTSDNVGDEVREIKVKITSRYQRGYLRH